VKFSVAPLETECRGTLSNLERITRTAPRRVPLAPYPLHAALSVCVCNIDDLHPATRCASWHGPFWPALDAPDRAMHTWTKREPGGWRAIEKFGCSNAFDSGPEKVTVAWPWSIGQASGRYLGPLLPLTAEMPFRGFGATFDEAWDNMNPRWADQIPKSPSVGRTLRQELGAVSKVVQFEEWQKSLDQGNDPIGKD
jgi:hypothetical protein